MSQAVEITRYPNRRLYDRSTKQYVTLGEIEEMVRSGTNICVRDSKSKEDLTRVILTQILIERHPERLQMFPVALLHEALRADQMAFDWLKAYLSQAQAFMNSLPSSAATPFVSGLDIWKQWMPGVGTQTPPDVEPTSGASPSDDSETEMAKRLAELERRLKDLETNRE
ncbi:MAG: polyhydroxyalkanoate synthesis regulator DNA-binding domain-containing protein [Planctomycetales bacterium]|nr:polyhydroxyalkanoate synthesis regulator DNA-binding domain-containing protein [Planctomycetales bacterium]